MRKQKKNKKLKAIDLFCGAGGSSYGALKAGVEIVAGFDIWNVAGEAYKRNFPTAKFFEGDLRNIQPEKIKKEIGAIDILLASPECTNHSVAKGSRDKCENSRMTAFQVTRYAEVFSPKWIIIENVVEMQSWSKHPEFIDSLWDLGFSVQQLKLNSADFGVPQARKRLFLVCANTSKVQQHDLVFSAKKIKPASTIIDRSDKYKFSPVFGKGRAENTLCRAERAIKALGSKQEFLMVYYGTGGGWQTLNVPLRTVTTLDRFALVIPSSKGPLMRMLQPEELKTAMGYKSDYSLDINATRREKIKLMGNGVCPPVMSSIVRSLYK